MEKINKKVVQAYIEKFKNTKLFIHLETTTGAYASHHEKKFGSGAFIRNAEITYTNGKITGNDVFRLGLEMEHGWVYAEGLTNFLIDENQRLILIGIDFSGKLAITLEISQTMFPK